MKNIIIRFLNYFCPTTPIKMFANAHALHDYSPVIQVMRIDSLEEKHEKLVGAL